MKQITQRLRDGSISVIDAPNPTVSPHGVLVDVRASLLSAGTERSKVETGRQSLIGKARARPDQVRQVAEKARRDGIRETIRTVRSRLDEPSGLGYSAAGVALAVGSRVARHRPWGPGGVRRSRLCRSRRSGPCPLQPVCAPSRRGGLRERCLCHRRQHRDARRSAGGRPPGRDGRGHRARTCRSACGSASSGCGVPRNRGGPLAAHCSIELVPWVRPTSPSNAQSWTTASSRTERHLATRF